MGILEMLAKDVVLGDGGYIVELEKRGYVIAGAFTPELALENPDAIRELHREFLRAGSEVLQVMAFYGSRSKLETVGKADQTFEINQKTTQIAKDVAGDDALVAGDLSATWTWEADNPSGKAEIAGMFDEQIEAQDGVDFFIGETFWHLGEALLCLERIKAKDKFAGHDHHVVPRHDGNGRRLFRSRLRAYAGRCRSGDSRCELHAGSRAHVSHTPRDARRHRRLHRRAAGCAPHQR